VAAEYAYDSTLRDGYIGPAEREGQGALVVEEASDPRLRGFAEQYHVPLAGLIGSGMGA
jgi:hypothetical protein